MIISVNWLKKYTDINIPIDELTALIGSRLVEIEELIDLNEKYKNIPIVRVVEASRIEGSDHLTLTKIDDGGVNKDVERDENGLVQVVCGAPNVSEGQLVIWLPPKVTVPSTFDKTEPFVLGSRRLQGHISYGMIASAEELDLFEDHTGILVVDKDVTPGTLFAEAYELNDYLLDIENKSLTHRPDCFGIIGFAREVAAITGQTFKTPDWLMNLEPDFPDSGEVKLSVKIDNPELSDRYQAIVVAGADSGKQSPLEIQTYLARVGVRPINAVVDVTNYLMMLTGQPMHAFDYDKLVEVGGGKAEIHVRSGRPDEKLQLLDGKTIALTEEDIVIAAGETAIALAGAMGGANTEIDSSTENIIIECATFNLYNLRGTQMRHGVFSEAITRFTKGVPAPLTTPVLHDAVRLMEDWAGAKPVSNLVEDYAVKPQTTTMTVEVDDINAVLGASFDIDIVANTLRNVEFEVSENNGTLNLTAPYWRADIHILEDVVEEVGRLNGFDNIKPMLPMRYFEAVSPSDFDKFRQMIRDCLARAGLNEVLSYSFVHGDVLKKVGQELDNSYKIVNSISPNLQYYRQSLTPSLLELIHPNVKQGYESFGLFELNKVHPKSIGKDEDDVPLEKDKLAVVLTNRHNQSGAPFYHVKRTLEYLFSGLGIEADYVIIGDGQKDETARPFEYRRSAVVIEQNTKKPIGFVGEFKKSVCHGFKLPDYTAGFEIDLNSLFESWQRTSCYTPISRYPSTERDVCFKVKSDVLFNELILAARQVVKGMDLEVAISPVDIYQPETETSKNITLRFRFTARDHTLTSDEVGGFVDKISEDVVGATQAMIV